MSFFFGFVGILFLTFSIFTWVRNDGTQRDYFERWVAPFAGIAFICFAIQGWTDGKYEWVLVASNVLLYVSFAVWALPYVRDVVRSVKYRAWWGVCRYGWFPAAFLGALLAGVSGVSAVAYVAFLVAIAMFIVSYPLERAYRRRFVEYLMNDATPRGLAELWYDNSSLSRKLDRSQWLVEGSQPSANSDEARIKRIQMAEKHPERIIDLTNGS